MRALFLIFHGFSQTNAGISKKIISQKDALERCGLDIRLCYLTIDQDGYHKRMIGDEVLENYGKGLAAKIKKRIQYSGMAGYILENDIKFLYIRSFHNANPLFVRFMKKLKRAGIKSAMEIPTYPYDQEYQNVPLSDRLRFLFDKLFRHQLAKYICRIVSFSNDPLIFGTPVINISNGIDFDRIRVKTKTSHDPGCLHLIGVAEIHFWHGFDRVLTGLAAYYKKQPEIKVIFEIVGGGVREELEKLKSITAENHLENAVKFHGPASGETLDRLFERADMGIASLGRHRSGITHIKPLKNREYAARGIPFVYSEIDDDFENMPYIMKAPADETPLDIEKLVRFFGTQQFEPAAIRKTITEKLSWTVQMKKVVDLVGLERIEKIEAGGGSD